MLEIVKVLIPWIISFFSGIIIAPVILLYLYKFKAWRRDTNSKSTILDESGKISKIINKNDKDLKTPRMGGLVIVFSVIFTIAIFWLVSFGVLGNPSGNLDILSRSETWLPFAAFIAGAIIGFFDDYFTIRNTGKFSKGLPLKYRLIFVAAFATFAGWWFQIKLGYDSIAVPFMGELFLGSFFIIFFVIVFTSVFATSNIDGLDGLSGGIMAIVYSIMGFIALYQDKFDISAFCFVIVGGILSFLWFNVPPAKFYMTEVGYNALSFTLVIVAFLTDTVLLLPIIAFPLFITLLTTILQVISIRLFKKRLLKIAPLHHHFEAMGWETSQIVMRYWIISIIFGVFGLVLAVISL